MNKITIFISIIGVTIAGLILSGSLKVSNPIGGEAFSRTATSSTIAVGPDLATTIFTKNNGCSSRVITTFGQAITLSFDPDITPSEFVGNIQAASTTVVYQNDDFGCGAVSVYGAVASSTIYKQENNY